MMTAAWHRIEGGYENATGTYRAIRSEIDDSWDSGAIVRRATQWIVEGRNAAGEFVPFELCTSLADAKRNADGLAAIGRESVSPPS